MSEQIVSSRGRCRSEGAKDKDVFQMGIHHSSAMREAFPTLTFSSLNRTIESTAKLGTFAKH